MLEVVKFTDGRYGIRNTWTGIILTNQRNGKTLSYRHPRSALRYMRTLDHNLAKTLSALSK